MANDGPEKLAKFAKEKELEFPVLVDRGAGAIRAFGVLNEANGSIPHPATVILDTEGIARFVRVDEDYRVRPAAEELIDVLESLASGN